MINLKHSCRCLTLFVLFPERNGYAPAHTQGGAEQIAVRSKCNRSNKGTDWVNYSNSREICEHIHRESFTNGVDMIFVGR